MMDQKYCPKCVRTPLDATDYHGEEVDVCRHCGGLWFEKNELSDMLSTVDNGNDEVNFEEQLGECLGASDLNCPDCAESLQRFHLLKDFELEVDVCQSCSGGWIDHEEIEQVEQSPRIRQALSNINGGTSWKTWVFQFLSQMPVEYNIKPHLKPIVTWSLIAMNVVIFLMYFGNESATIEILSQFANTPAHIAQGEQLWTLLTSTFLHGGIIHLLGNMYFLYLIGDNIEDALGHFKFLVLYLVCGVLASVISVLFGPDRVIPSVGASGAIAGLFGLYIIWFRHASLTFMFIVFQKKLSPVWYFAIWLGLNFWGMFTGAEGVDYGAHIGGFIVGILIALALKPYVLKRNPILGMLTDPAAQISR
ncbi:rhomboid family intramembrane serine protease [Litoribacillus peritrichatus]|uniref:Rhomboid family intramembrane serine protease n=1 Tax=Litoribacillus peritrichatus TaxID=718191 RepID=A0ABP7M903_9GAMM